MCGPGLCSPTFSCVCSACRKLIRGVLPQSSGNDIFYRNPFNVNENMFVGLSSPSSRKFSSIEDLGAPGTAAKKTLQQYLDELGTTRLGVQRSGEVVSASSRTAADGHLYYDVQVCC